MIETLKANQNPSEFTGYRNLLNLFSPKTLHQTVWDAYEVSNFTFSLMMFLDDQQINWCWLVLTFKREQLF